MSDARSDLDETDDTLIQAIQQGKHEAFERFLDRHVHHVRALLALKVPVAHLVDELAHEAFVFAYRNVHEFTVGTSVRAWLRAIAWNLLRAEIQRFSREQANQANFAAQSICEAEERTAMLDQERLIAYLANTLGLTERARVEAELAVDRAAQRHLADQQLMDQALRVALGGSAADQRVIESVLAVVRAAPAEQLRRDVLRDTVAAPLPSKGHVRPAWVRVLKAAVSPVDVLCALLVARPSRVRFACALAILTIVIGAGTWLHFRQSKAGEIGRFAAVVGAPKVHRVGKRSTLNAPRSCI